MSTVATKPQFVACMKWVLNRGRKTLTGTFTPIYEEYNVNTFLVILVLISNNDESVKRVVRVLSSI